MDPVTWAQIGIGAYQVISGLFGGGTPNATQAERDMLARTQGLQADSAKFRPYERRRQDDLVDLKDERDAAVGRGAAGVNQAVGGPPEMRANSTEGSFAKDVVGQNTMRNKALARVMTMSDAGVEQQGLRDRVAYGKHGANRAALALGQAGQLADIESWKRATDARTSADRNALIGDAVGTGLGMFTDWYRNRNPQPVTVNSTRL